MTVTSDSVHQALAARATAEHVMTLLDGRGSAAGGGAKAPLSPSLSLTYPEFAEALFQFID